MHDELTFTTLRATDLDPAAPDTPDALRFRGWGEAVSRGFHEGRLTDEHAQAWLAHARTDGLVARGAWPTRTSVASADLPVATLASWEQTIHTGSQVVPLHMITDITVSPTHRRRGLLRRLLGEDLADAAGRGLALAALTVSEGSIYGRFGFGVATRLRQLEVDTSARFALRTPIGDDGSLELAEPLEAWPAVRAVLARHHAATRGDVARPAIFELILTGRFDWETGAPDTKLRTVLHLDADGTPDGYAVYKPIEEGETGVVQVVDLVALTPAVHLRLWRYLAGVDLTTRVRWRRAAVDDALELAVTDPRVVRTTGLVDQLWVRVLDLPAALAARPWGADGSVVLEVADPLDLIAGRWRLDVRDGLGEAVRTDAEPGVRLDAETLGALYLGGTSVASLAAAGRIVGADVDPFAAMASGGPTPYNITGF